MLVAVGRVDDATVEDGWYLEFWLRVGALDDGMLPVNTAGSPGGGLQWPSGGDLVEWQLVDWLLKVLMMVAFWWSGSWWIGCRRC